MGKAKKRQLEQQTEVTESAGVSPMPAHRPAPGPLDTSQQDGRWGLHQSTMSIILEDGTPEGARSKVRASLDSTGTPELARSFVERLDRRAMRPSFQGYLRLHHQDAKRLKRHLPLCLAEGLALLEKRDPDLHYILLRCEPLGDQTQAEVGRLFDPPVAASTISGRRQRALDLLRGWLAGSSVNMPSVQKRTIPPELEAILAEMG